MSLYNQLFGRNPTSDLLLALLNLSQGDVGRFRDCYLARKLREEETEGELRIVVFTRNGGGNRDDYAGVTEALQGHPDYLLDFDDDFDCTYASYVFRVPEKFKATAEELASLGAESKESPMEKFQTLIGKLNSGDKNDPAVAKAMAVGKQIFESIEKAQVDGVSVVKV